MDSRGGVRDSKNCCDFLDLCAEPSVLQDRFSNCSANRLGSCEIVVVQK